MGEFFRVCLLAVFFFVLFFPFRSHGNENPGLFPVGEKESLLGNTGIAGVRSAGALYYNPATLVDLSALSLSVAGSAYLSYSISAEPLVQVDGTSLNFAASGLTTIPSTAVSTYDLSEGKVLALGVIIPEALVYDDHKNFVTPNTRTDIIISELAQDLRLGAGLGWRVSPKVSVGSALFLSRYAKTVQTATSVSNTTTANTINNSQTFENLSHYGLQMNLGGQFALQENLKLGVVFRLPLIGLGGSAKVFSLSNAVNAGTVTETRVLKEDVSVLRKIPWELGLGVSFSPLTPLQLVADISLQGSSLYKEVPDDPNGTTTDLKTQARFSLGGRLGLSEVFLLNLGLFYNPSAQRSASSTNALDQPLNFLGFSVGTDINMGRTQTSVGLYVAKSSATASLGSFNSSIGVSLVSAQVGFTYFLGEESPPVAPSAPKARKPLY